MQIGKRHSADISCEQKIEQLFHNFEMGKTKITFKNVYWL